MLIAEHDAARGVEQHEAGLQRIEHLLLLAGRRLGRVERARKPARQHQHDGQQHQPDRGTEVAVFQQLGQARAGPVPECQQQYVGAGQYDRGKHGRLQQRTQGFESSVHGRLWRAGKGRRRLTSLEARGKRSPEAHCATTCL